MKSGKVSLVGAGPGDPGLLTLKALRLLREADLVVYDYLANPEHLRHVKKGARTICVGKRFRYHRFSQDKINRMILKFAKSGKKVVRLKGGDPYLFGRGGEEALFLEERKVPFEVVPGVTSATACAAYSGIPLTHREHNSSVTFLTGHKAHDENLDQIDWRNIIALNGTIVIYMGFYNLGTIAKKLIQEGMKSSTLVSVIEWGTLPRQKSCDGTLASIDARVRAKKMGAPAIIIVGDVVSLKNKLNWYEKLPLFGRTVLVTRSRDKASSLRDKLEELGASVIELPTIEIVPPASYAAMDRAIGSLPTYDWVVFTSTYGADYFFDRLRQHKKDSRAFGSAKIASVGPETSAAIRRRGVLPDLEPKRYETSALVEEFKKKFGKLKDSKILLLRTNIAPPELEKGLGQLGARVHRVEAYRTRRPAAIPDQAKEALQKQKIDFVTFTSSSTATHFVRLLGKKRARLALQSARISSIGPVTSKTLRSLGLKVRCEAKTFTTDGLIEAMIQCL